MKTKAIFLDVDGTLISFKTHKIPQTTIDALNQVHNNGIKILYQQAEWRQTLANWTPSRMMRSSH